MAQSGSAPIVNHKPKDDAFHQQRLKTWQPILSPMNVIIIFTAVGVAFVSIGIGLMSISNNIYEQTFVYDSPTLPKTPACTDIAKCGCQRTAEYPTGHSCPGVDFTLTEDLDGPLYVYYGLDNFYQNHRLYVKSQNVAQLLGSSTTPPTPAQLEKDCGSKAKDANGLLLYPCGLIANSYFNDRFQLDSNSAYTLNEKDIAWKSDYDKFYNPEGFMFKEFNGQPCPDASYAWGLSNQIMSTDATKPKQYTNPDGVIFCYWYPNMDTFSYLWINPNDNSAAGYNAASQNYLDPTKGMQDEHLMVWMRTAGLPNFRKLYGTIKGPFKKGDILTFNINSNFEVQSFGGSKSLIISTISAIGGKNSYIGVSYVVVGCLSFLLTILFFIKHYTSERRKLGDTNLLRWED